MTTPEDSASTGSKGQRLRLRQRPRVEGKTERMLGGPGAAEPAQPKVTERLAFQAGLELVGEKGRYFLVRPIGEGGMGEVWGAKDASGRDVAIKTVVADARCTAEEVEQFQHRLKRESKALRLLDHPNIVKLRDVGQADRGMFYVMDRLEGQSLKERIERQKHLSPRELLGVLDGLALALTAVHQKKLVHRDLKPANIILSRDEAGREHAVLIDFGVVTAPPGGTELTQHWGRLGTPAYMSPEQFGASLDSRITAASDLWSLAVVVFECLVGRRPFDGGDSPSLRRSVLQDPVPELPQDAALRASAELPEFDVDGFNRWLKRALSKQPEQRYPSALALFADLVLVCGTDPNRPLRYTTRAVQAALAGQLLVGGRDNQLQREVLLHLLPAGRRKSAPDGAEFKAAAQALSSLQHPNVALLLDFVEASPLLGAHAVYLFPAECETLAERVARQPLDFELTRKVLRDVAAGLQQLAQVQLRPEALNPERLLLVGSGGDLRGVVADLHIPEAPLDVHSIKTLTAVPHGRAVESGRPSQAEEAAGVSERVRQLGVLAFTCLKGTPPGADGAWLLEASELGAYGALPAEVLSWLERTLAETPARRFSTVKEAMAALERVGPTDSLRTLRLGTILRWGRTQRWGRLAKLAAVGAVALAGPAIIAVLFFSEAFAPADHLLERGDPSRAAAAALSVAPTLTAPVLSPARDQRVSATGEPWTAAPGALDHDPTEPPDTPAPGDSTGLGSAAPRPTGLGRRSEVVIRAPDGPARGGRAPHPVSAAEVTRRANRTLAAAASSAAPSASGVETTVLAATPGVQLTETRPEGTAAGGSASAAQKSPAADPTSSTPSGGSEQDKQFPAQKALERIRKRHERKGTTVEEN